MANCIDNVLQMFPEADREDLSKVFDGMSKDAKEGFLDASGNPSADFMQKAEARLDAFRRGAQIAEIKTLSNIGKAAKNKAFVKDEAFDGNKTLGYSPRAEGVQSILTGTNKNVPGARDSVWHRMVAFRNKLVSGFIYDLESSGTPGLTDVLKAGADDLDIRRAWWAIQAGEEPSKTVKNDSAIKIAQALDNLQDKILMTKNDAGAFINRLEGRVGDQVYDRTKLLKVTRDEFVEKMLGRVDMDKSFKKDFYTQDAKEVLGSIYDRVTEGKGEILNLDGDDSKSTLKRLDAPANLARAMERSRSIHFASPEAAHEHMVEFGAGSMAQEVDQSIRQAARQSAMISKLGTNPELALRELTNGLAKNEKDMVQRHWTNITGEAQAPGVSTMATAGQNLRVAADMSKLGLSGLSHINNIGSRAGAMQMEGENFVSGLQASLEGMTKALTSDQHKEALYMAGANADAAIGAFFDRSGTTEGTRWSWINKAHQAYFKLTGIRLMSEIHEAANAQMLAARFGYHAETPYANLDPAHANVLSKYNIGPVEWDVIRKSVGTAEDGRAYAGIDTVNAMNPADVKDIMEAGGMDTSGREVSRFQRDVSTKLANYFADRSAIITGKPGAAERAALLNRGKNEDQVEGQLARLFSQFKGYGFTMANQFSKAYYYEALEGKGYASGAATTAPLLTSLTALGYLSWAAKNMVKGQTPPVPSDPKEVGKILTESMIRGGVGGIYADYLLGEFDSRHGRSAISALAGPTVGQIGDVADLVTQTRRAAMEGNVSQGKAAFSAANRFIWNNTIGNMPFVRSGLDYLFLNDMAETLNPGYMERQKARLEQQGIGQTFAGGQSGLLDKVIQ